MHKISFKNSAMTTLGKERNLFQLAEECRLRCNEDLYKGNLPFIELSYEKKMEEEIALFIPFFEGKKDLLVLGIGGSALGAKAIYESFSFRQDIYSNERKMYILDNLDEEYILYLLKELNPLTTGILVISKSGNTIESVCQYYIFKQWLQKHLGNNWKEHCCIITEVENGFLRKEVDKEGLLSAVIDKNLGGRYSVISVVGLLPAVFLGLDWEEMLKGNREYNNIFLDVLKNGSLSQFPSYCLALWHYLSEENGKTESIFFPYIPRFSGWSAWYAQLSAESLGKEGKGLMPILAQGVTDQHSLQQMFLDGKKNKICFFITEAKTNERIYIPDTPIDTWSCIAGKSIKDILMAEYIGTRSAFIESAIPFVEYEIPEITEYNIGKMIALLESMILLTGYLLGINPLNQPAVEYGKKIALSILQGEKEHLCITKNMESEIIFF
ncbi:MAG: glucose-6-phosphate isomerase [Desulfovibrionaceae bacterium]